MGIVLISVTAFLETGITSLYVSHRHIWLNARVIALAILPMEPGARISCTQLTWPTYTVVVKSGEQFSYGNIHGSHGSHGIPVRMGIRSHGNGKGMGMGMIFREWECYYHYNFVIVFINVSFLLFTI